MKPAKYKQAILPVAVIVAVLGPMFYYRIPWYVSAPDIIYVKAKVLQVLAGNLFTDPITGYVTFHPPYYHLFLSFLSLLGIKIESALMMVTVLNVSLIFFFAFKTLEVAFARKTAFYTCLLIPFIIEYMGSRNILLATSFYFSIPFYLAGLWLYLKSNEAFLLTAGSAVLWGLAFLISPVYLFLIGLTFIYEILIRRRYRRFAFMAAVFLITIIPFFIQAVYIYVHNLGGASTFAFWRGFPGSDWVGEVFIEFLSPVFRDVMSVPAAIHIIILIIFGFSIRKRDSIHWFIPLSAIAYLLTFYHFSGQYATRIHLFLSLFIAASVVSFLRHLKISQYIYIIPLAAVIVFSIYGHYTGVLPEFRRESMTYPGYKESGRLLWQNLDRHLEDNAYIFCDKLTYRDFVMPCKAVHSLGAYKTMEYFQLNPRISGQLENDYNRAMDSEDIAVIEDIAARYDIQTAVASGADMNKPLFKALSEHWDKVYRDRYFVIFKKPD